MERKFKFKQVSKEELKKPKPERKRKPRVSTTLHVIVGCQCGNDIPMLPVDSHQVVCSCGRAYEVTAYFKQTEIPEGMKQILRWRGVDVDGKN